MGKLFVRAAVAVMAAAWGIAIIAAPLSDPVLGTWQLNVSKSKFTAGPALKSQTRTYSLSAGKITLVMTTVGADGKAVTTRTTYEMDGKDFPVTGNPDYDTLSATQVDKNTASFTLKKAGNTVGTTRRKVSGDGLTLTSESKLTTAKGEKTESVMVFDAL
jgi:hypothetical protein